MTTYLRLEMPYYLIKSYADLSVAQSHYLGTFPHSKYSGFSHNFALLSLNAAIVEGTLRSILHWYLFQQQEQAIKKGKSLGQIVPDLAERTLIKLRLEVDTSDTWAKLKEKFSFIFGKSIADVVTQNVLAEVEHLFMIRNRSAHGSSIQLPKHQISAQDDEYLFALQGKLEKLGSFLNSKFGSADIYEGLGNPKVAELFWDITKSFANSMNGLYMFPPELQKNIDAIKNYNFGKVFIG